MKSKDLFFILLFLFSIITGYSQVAINTNAASPEASAMLDINAADKGLLIPRLEITDVDSDLTPVESPAEGLLIYNIGNVDGIPKGFYYWAEAKWNGVTTGNSSFTVNQLLQMYEAAELYECNNMSSPSTISLVSSSESYGWVTAIEGELFGLTSTETGNSIADKIVIGADGLYKIEFCFSASGTNNMQLETAVWKTPLSAAEDKTRVRCMTKLGAFGDIVSGSAHGLLRLYAGEKIDIRFRSTSWGETLDLYILNFVANKVGEIPE